MSSGPSFLLVVAALSWLGAHAEAAALRVDFSGTVDVFEVGEGGEPLGDSLSALFGVGTGFSGHFTLDDAAAPYSSTEYRNSYLFPAPLYELEVTLADQRFGREPWYQYGGLELHQIRVVPSIVDGDVSYGGQVSVNLPTRALTSFPGSDDVTDFYLELGDGISGPTMSRELSQVPWNLGDFERAIAGWYFIYVDAQRRAHTIRIEGALDSLSVTPVPEPARDVLVALALAALAFRRARR